MSELSDRELLDISLGDKDLSKIDRKLTNTFIDHLPKDVIQYLKRYTGPTECFYSTLTSYKTSNNRYYQYRAWVGKTEEQAKYHCRRNRYCDNVWRGPFVEKGKLIFIDGVAHVAVPVYRNHVYGMRRKSKKIIVNKSRQCSGKTVQGKRCKHRVVPSKEWKKGDKLYCSRHTHK